MIYVDPTSYLPADAERERYLKHRNGPDQPGHVAFLSRIVEAVAPRLTTGMRGLDFGCGPVPTLSVLLRDRGFACDDYDPFFAPQPLHGPYDFITATEVFEHLFSPDREIRRLRGLLRVGGLLAVMTEQWTSLDDFSRWYYTRDPTHVSFFHEKTFAYMGRVYGFETIFHDDRVVILRRVPAPRGNRMKSTEH